uniref:Tetratricopeptide repeat protein n=1 Tax=Streptomyces sp. NBC_00093 TaxID=2975649 RepID=A0AAU2AG45_9ACTN
MGGIGKTALALEAAHRVVSKGLFPGGALFVDLRGYDDNPVTADQAVLALLDALGVRGSDLPPTAARQYDAYHALLAERQHRTLLILDNASDPAQFLPLLPASDHHRVLITSRDRPDGLRVRLIDLEALTPAESSALITGALHDADERDDRPTREPDALRELTDLCCHLPLALQIAAAMLRRRRHRGIASLVAEIKEAEDATTAFDRGNLGTDQYGRSLALRPVLETSYHRLPADQARMLRLLALAPAPEIGTEAVAALTDLGTDSALALLEELAATHLVTAVPGGDSSNPVLRWRLHDLVRAFGAGVVAGDAELAEEAEAARERVLGFYWQWAGAANEWLQWLEGDATPGLFRGRREALVWLDGERAGLVGAVQWAVEERYAGAAVRLASCLGEYLYWRRYFDDWVSVGVAACAGARSVGDREGEAVSLSNLGVALRNAGRAGEAIDAYTRALDLDQAVGDRRNEGMSWDNLGTALQEAGRGEEAVDAHTRALDLLQVVGDRHGEGRAWNNLGLALQNAGRGEEAINAHTRALDLFQAVGSRHGEGKAWNNLGIALYEADLMEEAIEAYDRDVEICREFEDWYGAGQTLSNLALARKAADHPSEARVAWLQAAEAYAQVGATEKAAEAQACAGEEAEGTTAQA